ncbi:hypothetical protein VTI74DRAFT_4362 [Chaetomium olivicolor]
MRHGLGFGISVLSWGSQTLVCIMKRNCLVIGAPLFFEQTLYSTVYGLALQLSSRHEGARSESSFGLLEQAAQEGARRVARADRGGGSGLARAAVMRQGLVRGTVLEFFMLSAISWPEWRHTWVGFGRNVEWKPFKLDVSGRPGPQVLLRLQGVMVIWSIE